MALFRSTGYLKLDEFGVPTHSELPREKTPEERIAGLEAELAEVRKHLIYCVDYEAVPVYVEGSAPEGCQFATAAEINALVKTLEAFRAASIAGKPDDGSITRFTCLCMANKTMYGLDMHGLVWFINLTSGQWERHLNPGEKYDGSQWNQG